MSAQSVFDLSRENTDLHRRLEEAEETIRALRAGEADALLVEGEQEQVYTLETAEKPYRLLVEQMPYAAATLTCEGNIIYCNRRFAEALYQPLQSLLGRPLQEFIAPVSRGQVERMLQDALQREAGEVEGDVTLLRPDGSPIDTYVGVGALQEGALGQCLMVTDLTQQRHYQELQRTQAALRASEERLELAQRAGGIGTFEWNIQTGRVTWSAVLEELYGLPPGGFGDRYEDWQALVHPADRARTAAAANEAVTGRRDLDIEFRIVRPDGNIRWIASRGRAFYQGGAGGGAAGRAEGSAGGGRRGGPCGWWGSARTSPSARRRRPSASTCSTRSARRGPRRSARCRRATRCSASSRTTCATRCWRSRWASRASGASRSARRRRRRSR